MYYLIILSLTVQNVLTNEYVYPYPQLYDQQSNEYNKDPISLKKLRYENEEPPQPEANPIKVQNDALVDEVHTKYLNSPKQIYKKDSYKSLDDRIQKLKLTIGDHKTLKKKKILLSEIVKIYNKYKDGEHNDYKANAYIEQLPAIIFQNLYSRIAEQHNMNTDGKGHIRFKRDLNSEKNNVTESAITNSTLKTNVTEDIRKKFNCSEAKDGRRVYDRADRMEQNLEQIQNPPAKTKLIGYIDDVLAEMEIKIQPVIKQKDTFSTNDMFKAGYIIAHIDTLGMSIKKLKADMDNNKDSWDEQAAMDVFDKVMTTNKILKNLLTTLQLHTKFNENNMTLTHPEKVVTGLPESPKIL